MLRRYTEYGSTLLMRCYFLVAFGCGGDRGSTGGHSSRLDMRNNNGEEVSEEGKVLDVLHLALSENFFFFIIVCYIINTLKIG